MSEEEKEAIKLLKKDSTDYYYRSIDVRNAVRVALDYIEKLQKENQELKEKLHEKNERIIELNKLLGDKV